MVVNFIASEAKGVSESTERHLLLHSKRGVAFIPLPGSLKEVLEPSNGFHEVEKDPTSRVSIPRKKVETFVPSVKQ